MRECLLFGVIYVHIRIHNGIDQLFLKGNKTLSESIYGIKRNNWKGMPWVRWVKAALLLCIIKPKTANNAREPSALLLSKY